MRSYLRYQLKNNIRPLVIITVIILVMGFFICAESMERVRSVAYCEELQRTVYVSDEHPGGYYYANATEYVDVFYPVTTHYYVDTALYYPAFMLIVLCYIVPVWMFAFLKKKRNLDCYYSLPISRRAIGVTHYLSGLVAVLVPFLLSYALNMIMLLARGYFANLAHEYIIAHFLLCLLMGFTLYSLFVFVFNEANSVIDGIIYIAGYSFVLYILATSLNDIYNEVLRTYYGKLPMDYDMDGIIDDWGYGYYTLIKNEMNSVPWAFFGDLLSGFESAAEVPFEKSFSIILNSGDIVWLIFWSGVGMLSAVGSIIGFGRKNAERAEEISSTPFGYKTLIPLVGLMLVVSLAVADNEMLTAIVVTIACAVLYTIYRRGVKYKTSDYVVIGIMMLLSLYPLIA